MTGTELRLRLREQQNERKTFKKALEFIITPIEKGNAEQFKMFIIK